MRVLGGGISRGLLARYRPQLGLRADPREAYLLSAGL